MKDLLLTRLTLVWALLVGATLISWELGHGVGFHDVRSAGAAILVVTFIKLRLVAREFMELRHAPRWMRLVADAWLLLVCVGLVGLYLHTPG